VARALIVGCGCRGRELGSELRARGWPVRGTTRGPALAEIERAGLEPAVADPDRPGTVLELCADAAVVVWLLGSARGEPQLLSAIHGPRLERLLERLVESPVRGFVYESMGSAPRQDLGEGRAIVESAARTWRIPAAFLDRDRSRPGWATAAADAVEGVLTPA
jgi:nucleoside-diphosphate-sugar epimerase